MHRIRHRHAVAQTLLVCLLATGAQSDWPTYRHDPSRSAITTDTLAGSLHLQWVLVWPATRPAWDNQKEVYSYGGPPERVEQKVSFDIAYEPVVAGSTVYIGSPNNDRLTALSLSSGSERWRFYAGGPIRFAPAVHADRVYVGSDDGRLYCLSTNDGHLVWQRRIALSGRLVMGNDRLVSVWPVRGAPVLAPHPHDSTRTVVYCAAGLYSFEGAVVCALDAATGEPYWTNDGNGMFFTANPHGGSEGIAGLSPQGYLCVTDSNGLLVPNGRALPALLDRETGQLRYWRHGGMKKGLGGYHVAARGDTFYCRDHAFLLSDGSDAGDAPPQYREWDIQIQVGGRMFRVDSVREAEIAGRYDDTFTVTDSSWSADVEGMPKSLVAANGRLLVSTVAGRVYCFGPDSAAAPAVGAKPADSALDAGDTRRAEELLTRAGYRTGMRGQAFVFGLTDGRLMAALHKVAGDLTVVGFDPDSARCASIRTYLDSRGIYGRETHVITGPVDPSLLPSYGARIITTELERFPRDMASPTELYRVLHPYGGQVLLDGVRRSKVLEQTSGRVHAAIDGGRRSPVLSRTGLLPGADTWTHEHHSAAQTNFSRDSLVRTPLGILWFGGSADNTNDAMLPRHGHGQSPHVAGGHTYQLGRDLLRCVDQYTGRVLWEKPLPYIGQFSDYTEHEAGNIGLGDYFTAQEDRVYVLSGRDSCELSRTCLVLDPFDGSTMAEFSLPDGSAYGMLAISDSFLIAASQPIEYDSAAQGDCYVYWYKKKSLVGPGGLHTLNYAASRALYVLNRYDGTVLWKTTAERGYFHRAVAAGGGRLYAIDRHPDLADTTGTPRLKVWDIRTGTPLWTDSSRVFARYLAYSLDYDLLVQASRNSRDYFKGEPRPNRMVVYNAADGTVRWEVAPEMSDDGEDILKEINYYGGPVMLNGRTVITQDGNNFGALDLLDGSWRQTPHPLTGEPVDFYFRRHYGCTHAKGCPGLIAFRSGNASMFDLENMSGIHNFGGFKSGCTPSLIPGGGLLNAPEYTRSCGCSYPIQTSCAMVYNPSTEVWTTNEGLARRTAGAVLEQLGLNVGAPGDRMDSEGMLWLDYPGGATNAGFSGQEFPLAVTLEGDSLRYYRHHSLTFDGAAPWVCASGVTGLRALTIDFSLDSLLEDSTVVTVRAPRRQVDITLYFAEPDAEPVSTRSFDISLNDSLVARAYAPATQAGGLRRGATLRCSGVTLSDSLRIALTPVQGHPVLCGVSVQKARLVYRVPDADGVPRGYVDLSLYR